MGFLFGILGSMLGIIIAFFIIIVCVMSRVNKTFGKESVKQLINFAKSSKDLARQEYSRKKTLSGMTKVLEPSIIRDFPDFNKNLLFSMIEKNLIKIFNSIENKSINEVRNDSDLVLISTFLEDYIKDIKERNITISYNDIKFHAHAIKSYEKSGGVATITTSSTLEYFYSNSENEDDFADVKKQTRYTCKFVYIYDESKLNTTKEVFTMNCPNCGAPISGLGELNCEYCSSYIEPINLKAWKIASYKEDY